MQDVVVRNLSSNQSSKTKAAGQFSINAKVGELLEFSFTGYHTDTLFLIDLSPKTIYLPANSTNLKEVKIVSAKVNPSVFWKDPDARPSKRFSDDNLYGKGNNDRAGGIRMGFGYAKMQRDREKVQFLEERERYEEEIRNNFNEETISKLVKLRGQELKDFILFYKPTVPLIKSERPFNYTYYIVKGYHHWLKLPEEQKKVPPMPKLKAN